LNELDRIPVVALRAAFRATPIAAPFLARGVHDVGRGASAFSRLRTLQ